MLTRSHFLLPGLDFGLPRKSACFENAINQARELPTSSIDIFDVTFKTLDNGSGLIAVLFCLCSNSQLCDLLGRLVSLNATYQRRAQVSYESRYLYLLSSPPDVQG